MTDQAKRKDERKPQVRHGREPRSPRQAAAHLESPESVPVRTAGNAGEKLGDQSPEELMRAYTEAPIGLCYLDTNLRFVHINNWLAEINGMPVKEHLGRSISEVLPDVALGVEPQFRHVIETGEPIVGGTVDAETAADPGVKRRFRHNYHAVKSDAGTVVGVACVVEDITEQSRMGAALAEKSALLETTLESMSQGIAVFDADLRLTAFNQRYLDLRDYPKWYISLGMSYEKIVRFNAEQGDYGPGDSVKQVKERLKAARQGKPWRREYTKADGTALAVGFDPIPAGGFVATITDITERKRAEEALQKAHDVLESRVKERTRDLREVNRNLQSETAERIRQADRYKSLLDAAPDPTIAVDHDGKIIEISAEVEHVLGYGRDELIGQDMELLVPEGLRGDHVQLRQAYSKNPQTRPMGAGLELAVRCKSGRELLVEVSLNPARISEERVVIASIRDITQRKEISMALGESKERYRQLLESTNAIPWEADAKTWMFTYVGPQAVELLGYPRELWLEKDFWVEHIHPADRAKTIDDCLKSSAQRENYELEYRMITADGRVIWLQDIVNVMKQEGDPVTLRGFMLDITERKSLEDLQRNTSARLINAQEEERSKISRELHDDFGQRLALLAVDIQGLGQKISEPEFEGAKSLDKLWSQTRKLSTDLHRLSHQLHPAILHQLGLGPAIRSLCSEISEQHGIKIKFTEHEVPASISRDIALCLYRTVQEGLRNIVKHSEAEDAKVELTGGPDTIHLRIADRGVGFDPETTKGKGLGLISIEERIRLVQGEMSLQSRPAHGTCIDLRIPLATPDA